MTPITGPWEKVGMLTWLAEVGLRDPLTGQGRGRWHVDAHSTIHAWRIPWTEEPSQLQSMGLHSCLEVKKAKNKKVNGNHDLSDNVRLPVQTRWWWSW